MSGFRFRDSLTVEMHPLTTREPGVVRMYNCGPTVYSKPHLGNYRAYTCWDVLRRALELGGWSVRQVVNITDVGHLTDDDLADAAGEDKLEKRARREGRSAHAIAAECTAYFFRIGRILRWRFADDPDELHPRATAYVRDDRDPGSVRTMVGHIAELVRRGHAYVTPAGNVYFEVSTFPAYGRLSGNTLDGLVAGARVEVIAEKRHPADFALWKRDPAHQMQWDSPWGSGFPGWHIECSVMARALLGDTLDIHTGGEDHLFPHHECEIAQSEALTGKPLAEIWMHNRFLLVDGEKMSKSKGTLFLMEDIEARCGDGTEAARRQTHRALRYLLLSVHYRTPTNFTWEALDAARATVESLDAACRGLAGRDGAIDRQEVASACAEAGRAFLAALQEDLNVSAALAVVHEFRKFAGRVEGSLSHDDAARMRDRFRAFDAVLALDLAAAPASSAGSPADAPHDPAIDGLVADRESARARRDFAKADEIRDELARRRVTVEDTPDGPRWHRR